MNSPPIRREGRSAPYSRVRLRRKRIEAGLSQRLLAEKAGVSKQLISALECGESGASPASLAAIADALECPVTELMRAAS